jgi:hypothetical protein
MNLVIAADVALACVLSARGIDANLPLLGFLFMGNILVLAPRNGAGRGFGIGGTIALVGFLACCWLSPGRVRACYETYVATLSKPLEDAWDYGGGSFHARPLVPVVATLVNAFESFLISLPMIAFALLCGAIGRVTRSGKCKPHHIIGMR